MFFIPFNSYLLALSDSYPVVYVSPFHEGSAEETPGGWEEGRVGGGAGREMGRRENWRRLFFILSSCGRPICQDAALVSRDRVQNGKERTGVNSVTSSWSYPPFLEILLFFDWWRVWRERF